MKRTTAAALAALCLLSGCAQEAAPLPDAAQGIDVVYQRAVTIEKTAMAQEAALELMRQFALEHKVTFSFTPENFPATAAPAAAAPLLRAAAGALLDGNSGGRDAEAGEYTVPGPVVRSDSGDACRALLDGSASLVLTEEPPAALWDEMDAAGFNWDMAPVAADALVFAVSAGNPVDSLSIRDLRNIYAGTITNWSALGGPDLPVLPLRGGPGSDMETAMENLIMDGVSMVAALPGTDADALPSTDALPDEGADALPDEGADALPGTGADALADRAAQPGAIVCAGFYQARAALSGADAGWKLVRVEGAEPSEDSIRSGSYPLLNRCYALISAAAPQDSPERALRDWLSSRDGQELAARAGFIPMMDLGGMS